MLGMIEVGVEGGRMAGYSVGEWEGEMVVIC